MHNINPLKTQLNLICNLLALLGAHHILHVSRIRVKPVICQPSQPFFVCFLQLPNKKPRTPPPICLKKLLLNFVR